MYFVSHRPWRSRRGGLAAEGRRRTAVAAGTGGVAELPTARRRPRDAPPRRRSDRRCAMKKYELKQAHDDDMIVEKELTGFWLRPGERLLFSCPPIRGYVLAQ